LALSDNSVRPNNVQLWTSLAVLAVKCSEKAAIGLSHRSGIPHLWPTAAAQNSEKAG
jgi:hypothetical protein